MIAFRKKVERGGKRIQSLSTVDHIVLGNELESPDWPNTLPVGFNRCFLWVIFLLTNQWRKKIHTDQRKIHFLLLFPIKGIPSSFCKEDNKRSQTQDCPSGTSHRADENSVVQNKRQPHFPLKASNDFYIVTPLSGIPEDDAQDGCELRRPQSSRKCSSSGISNINIDRLYTSHFACMGEFAGVSGFSRALRPSPRRRKPLSWQDGAAGRSGSRRWERCILTHTHTHTHPGF